MTEGQEEAVDQEVQQEKPLEEASAESTEERYKDKDYNFSQVRKQLKEKDDYIREKDDYIKALHGEIEEIKKAIQPKQQEPAEPDLDDDDFVTKKYLMRDAKKIAQQEVESAINQYEQKNYRTRAKEQYSDFDNVVTAENLNRLEEEMPEIASLIAQGNDKFKMACSAYKAIKRLNYYSSPEKEIQKNKEAIKKNSVEPLAAAAVDRRPIAQAARLTDKDYQELWQEMEYYKSKG